MSVSGEEIMLVVSGQFVLVLLHVHSSLSSAAIYFLIGFIRGFKLHASRAFLVFGEYLGNYVPTANTRP